mmetsp:Transcript_47148/g.102606  ORF Transcript_47148/g.102606 Transcript_47148/m.102606 type:complete len:223 (-) Transcript_47148:719-1387(-)
MVLPHVLLRLQSPEQHGDHVPLLGNASAVQRREQGLAGGNKTRPTVHQLFQHRQIPPLRCQVQRGNPIRRRSRVDIEARSNQHPENPHAAGGPALRRRGAADHRRVRGTDTGGAGLLTPLRHLNPSEIERNPLVLDKFQNQPHRLDVPSQAGSGQRRGARYLRGRRALSWALQQAGSAGAQQHVHQATVFRARSQVEHSRRNLEALLRDQQLEHADVPMLHS